MQIRVSQASKNHLDWEGSDVCISKTVPTVMGYLVHLPLCSLDLVVDCSRLLVQHFTSQLHHHSSHLLLL